MQVNKNVTIETMDELITVIQKLAKGKRTFNFSGNVNNGTKPETESYNVSCTEETDEF